MESVKWSYSSMSLFQLCPKKYYHLRVAKDITEPTSEQMRYGLMAHTAAEEYIRDGVPLPPAFSYMQDALDKLKAYPGEKLCEQKLALTRDLQPCGFFDKDVWWRGIADFVSIDGSTARIVDYKTGKNTYPDTKQLELLSLALFKHHPYVTEVKAGLLFVVHPAFIKITVRADEAEERWKQWVDKSGQLDHAMHHNVWNPKQNFTCRGWCPVTSCAHNGRRN